MRPVRRADNLTTFMCRLVWNLGASNSWERQRLSKLVLGLLYPHICQFSPIEVRWYRCRAFGHNHWSSWQSNSMTDSAWNDDSAPASEKITHILWSPNIPDRIHNSPPLQNILSQINPVHNLLFYFFKTRFNIILPSLSVFVFQGVRFCRLPHQNFVYISLLPQKMNISCPSHAPCHNAEDFQLFILRSDV